MKRIKKLNWLAIIISSMLTFVLGVVASYVLIQTINFQSDLEDARFDDFLAVYDHLNRDHYFFDENRDLIRGAIDGMIASTGDSYTRFFSMTDFENAMGHLRESFYGIGAEVMMMHGRPVIVTPFSDSPAENAGVLPGDVIMSVDGVDTSGEALWDVINRIRGYYGTVVTLEVMRGTNSLSIDITRGRITNETVRREVIEHNGKNIGLIQVTTFGKATAGSFEDAIAALEEEGIDGLVIDMRNNAGGYLNAVNQMVSYLLPSGRLITAAVDREGNTMDHMTRGDSDYRLDVPIVTIINEGSASASEIFAAAMMESADFEVVGVTSFGKGTVQQSRPIGQENMLQMTIQAWLTPDGNQIEGRGVTPSVYVEAPDFHRYLQVHLGEENYLQYDMVHAGVANAQLILNLLGFETNRTDGFFDQSTTSAVEAFQSEWGLAVTGVIDQDTANELSWALRGKIRNVRYDSQVLEALDLFN